MRGIYPRKIKGFRDIDASLNQLRWKIIEAASAVYKKYGYEHWDTPVLEYADSLGKYLPDADSVAEGVYSFKNPEIEPVYGQRGDELRDADNNVIMENHHLTLRYDLTAPLARVYAENIWTSYLRGEVVEGKANIFRRYQFGPVYRFEAKLDPGRFREFWQLDFDTVGSDDVTIDAENCMILSEALEAIGLKRGTYLVKLNNRKIMKGLLAHTGVTNETTEQNVMRAIDKLDKIGINAVAAELGKGRKDEKSGAFIDGLNLDNTVIDQLVNFIHDFENLTDRKTTIEKLRAKQTIQNPVYSAGVDELELISNILDSLEVFNDRVVIDPSLIRGMGYYTGPIFEVESLLTYTDEKGRTRKVGSICGGGRYDGLVHKLLPVKVPATGASIGVDRLAELLSLTNNMPEQTDGAVLIVVFDDKMMPEYQKIAKELRENSINTEIYYGAKKGLKHQLAYADQKNAPFALLLGEDELNKGVISVRNLKLGKLLADSITDKTEWKNKVQQEVERKNLVNYLLKAI